MKRLILAATITAVTTLIIVAIAYAANNSEPEQQATTAEQAQEEPAESQPSASGVPADPTPEPEPEKKATTVLARVTAYAPFDNRSGICNDGDPTNTSTGRSPGREYAAADPQKLPYGTKLEIPGYGTVEIQDTGGALRSYDGIAIDVYFDSYEEAMKWGVQYLEIKIPEQEDER